MERETIPVACTLEAEAVPDRVADWQRLLAGAIGREAIEGGVRVRFGTADPELAGALATLAAAEQSCCSFFRFALLIEGDGTIALDVTAPDEGASVVAALFGQPS